MGSISINDDKIIGGSKSITASTTLAPPCDMNLSLDTANITLTLDPGAFIGQKLSVVANATSSIVFLGVNGTTTEGLTSGKKALLTWTGSYWLCSVSVVIQGKSATGLPFYYSGGLSVEALPDKNPKSITINNSILDPSETDVFSLRIDTYLSSVTLLPGAYAGQRVYLINRHPTYTVTINFNGDKKYYLAPGRATWFVRGPMASTSWYFDSFDSHIVSENQTITPINDMFVIINTENVTATFGDGNEIGHTVHLYSAQNNTFFRFKGTSVGDIWTAKAYAGYCSQLVWNGTYWHYIVLRGSHTYDVPIINTGALATGGFVKYTVKNGWCFLSIGGLYSTGTNAQWYLVAGTVPKPISYTHIYTASDNQIRIEQLNGLQYVSLYRKNGNAVYASLSYPVVDTWIDT